MTRSEISATLTRAGIEAELTPTGLIINGVNIIHNDKTGISIYKSSRFRAKDVWDFLQYLADEGVKIDTSTLHRARKAEKIS